MPVMPPMMKTKKKPSTHHMGVRRTTLPVAMVAIQQKICAARRDGDHHACGGEVAFRHLRNAGGEHVMYPEAEGDKAGRDERQAPAPDIRRHAGATEGGDDGRDDRRARNEDDVDLGMSEPPEEMLIEQDVATDGGIEELGAAGAVQQQHGAREHDAGQGEDHHERRRRPVPRRRPECG